MLTTVQFAPRRREDESNVSCSHWHWTRSLRSRASRCVLHVSAPAVPQNLARCLPWPLRRGGSLNPARSFGPCVVLTDFESYHWIYWLGPALGAVVAAGFYRLLKYITSCRVLLHSKTYVHVHRFLEYETVLGPDADAEHQDHPEAQHEHDPERDTNGHAHNGHAAVAPELAAPGPLLLGGPVSCLQYGRTHRDWYRCSCVRICSRRTLEFKHSYCERASEHSDAWERRTR
jgi:hypothetical protein